MAVYTQRFITVMDNGTWHYVTVNPGWRLVVMTITQVCNNASAGQSMVSIGPALFGLRPVPAVNSVSTTDLRLAVLAGEQIGVANLAAGMTTMVGGYEFRTDASATELATVESTGPWPDGMADPRTFVQ